MPTGRTLEAMLPALQLLLAVAGTYLLPTPHAARFRVWDESGQPIALVAYSFAVPQAAVGLDTLTVSLTLHQWGSAGAAQFDTTFRAVGVRIDDHETRFTGLLQTTRSAALDSWTLTAVGDPLTAPILVGQGSAPSHDGDAIAASDLMLGTSRSAVAWVAGERHVPLTVDLSFDRTEPIQMHFQGWSRGDRSGIRATMTVTDISDPQHGHRVLVLGFNVVLRAGVTDFVRELEVSRLSAGRYLIELTMGDQISVSTSVQSAEFVLRR